jgi:hypothetical protein
MLTLKLHSHRNVLEYLTHFQSSDFHDWCLLWLREYIVYNVFQCFDKHCSYYLQVQNFDWIFVTLYTALTLGCVLKMKSQLDAQVSRMLTGSNHVTWDSQVVTTKGIVGFVVLTVVIMKSSIFWNIMLYSPLKVNWHFIALPPAFTLVFCSANSSTQKMEAICSYEMSAHFQWTTWCYITEDSNLY